MGLPAWGFKAECLREVACCIRPWLCVIVFVSVCCMSLYVCMYVCACAQITSSVFVPRYAYETFSHNWWQFTDDLTLFQLSATDCTPYVVHSYVLSTNQAGLPWNSSTFPNVLAGPVSD